MLQLVAAGEVSPSAARVAETAKVGLRTVFRHFDDMDSLYREMSEAIEERITEVLLQPFKADHWRDRLLESVERRASVYEIIMPYRVSADTKRFESEFLQQDRLRLLRLERTALEATLPQSVLDDRVQTRALSLILSFQSWRALRQDEELSVSEAKAVVARLLANALSTIDA
ncbi:TetR/AcrR family transcriptional regulator [Parasphingopyxis algicola]|nr:TetR/AcrR family transcriptional regulator [Parasphingopyxis algicola]